MLESIVDFKFISHHSHVQDIS